MTALVIRVAASSDPGQWDANNRPTVTIARTPAASPFRYLCPNWFTAAPSSWVIPRLLSGLPAPIAGWTYCYVICAAESNANNGGGTVPPMSPVMAA